MSRPQEAGQGTQNVAIATLEAVIYACSGRLADQNKSTQVGCSKPTRKGMRCIFCSLKTIHWWRAASWPV